MWMDSEDHYVPTGEHLDDEGFYKTLDEFYRVEGRPSTKSEPLYDVVDKPSHYARWLIEPATFIMTNGFEFWRGNIVKYACRAGFKLYDGKSKKQSEITDLEKIIKYAQMRIEQLEAEE